MSGPLSVKNDGCDVGSSRLKDMGPDKNVRKPHQSLNRE